MLHVAFHFLFFINLILTNCWWSLLVVSE